MPMLLFFIGSNIETFLFTSCIRSLSEETIKESIFLFLANFVYEAIMSSASYPSNSNCLMLKASTHCLINSN